MQFVKQKRRQAPAIIIISLIDVLIVMLIFLMVTTTFKQQPALKLVLPESRQPKEGASEARLIITVDKREPFLYLGPSPVTVDKLQAELRMAAIKDPQVRLAIRADTDAPFGQFVKVMDAAKAASIKNVEAWTKTAGAGP